ncbi:MAG: prolipoprotein diacylglyceryl transferase [Candidatus Omnitrophica bacterium]|nr:prolipoprotein diacylglyceryl transferase [Candidatus Omnitrophota bacterium]
MHPLICSIGPFKIYSYGLMLALAFFISFRLVLAKSSRKEISAEIIYNFSFGALISGIIGARLFFVLENAGYYLKRPLEIFMLQHGGLSWFGGLALGAAFSFFYLKKKKLSVYKVLDLYAPFLALGQSIGRIGCFLNGCCYGKVSVYGIYFPAHGQVLIPTQIYSSLALAIIFLTLRLLQEKPHEPSAVFFTYLFLYSLQRFFIEFLRADNAAVFSGLTIFHFISAGIFCLSSIKLLALRRARR